MDELVKWLGEQLDEDERIAKAVGYVHIQTAEYLWGSKYLLLQDGPDGESKATTEFDPVLADFIAQHDPARVLREVEAKRELLKEHKPDGWDCSTCAAPETYDDDADGNREWSRDGKSFPCPTLRLLASVYSDRPGYREEWRPN